ncbi:alkaline phosphatase family protein [Flavobacteriaceae bacterium TP-CH-4]|uniref:Alkaline phosphatase family protein n=1 Tax=Pelagihabitans pacificus TaxID=2696054 RepID=A0A967AXK5_9FLAO|nr:alkaline phosphatase D family protein [Pelagihabitans pacificus]NHF61160.1 alkaline phosphatase family protein [Pelagihabitans pacificus]
MNRLTIALLTSVLMLGCKATQINTSQTPNGTAPVQINSDFTIAFGSCNKTDIDNVLWDDILSTNPNIWIWGGDNIYADTDDIEQLRGMYRAQQEVKGYKRLTKRVPVVGTWDDHDYGLNDGGREFTAKRESQQEFLDFMGVPKDSPRRKQEGVYTVHDFQRWNGSIKIIVLDTRYFRTSLTPDTETDKRIKPNRYGEGTLLGDVQWQWLENQLKTSEADFNLIVSSIQVLSNEHGFECWGNFPHEVDKLKKMIVESGAQGVLFLSGDRHISEFSQTRVEGLSYPLIDFTSSGLTHAYSDFKGEPNPFRVGEVVSTESFGLLRFDFLTKTVQLMMVGDNGVVLNDLRRKY